MDKVAEIAKMIDHSLLHPALTDLELKEGCEEAVEFHVASACVKPCDVLQAAKAGRVDKMIVDRTFHPLVERCQNCHSLNVGEVETCMVCGSKLLFKVSLINEILDMLIQSGAEFHFADSMPELEAVGGIAALLRY